MCHQAQNGGGKLSLASYAGLQKGGELGAAIKPGDPDASPLLQFISGGKPRMPKAGVPLNETQVALIRRWITEGAKDDSLGGSDDVWWSLRPLRPVTSPAVSGGRNSIDSFILAELSKKGLAPSPEADRRTLIRRLYFDLAGLPPTPAELAAFLADPAPDAYEKIAGRLLASPRYGERWARHWLDVVHYGDSHGYDKDKPRSNAWPYRDYVIRAFNDDKPYARFIQEQLAGDVLFPSDPSAFVATGFIAAGPWDFVGHQELRERTTEKDTTRLLDRDDMVAQTVSTFNSMTAHCARCHDHKFDPIPQADYYNLQAVFAGVDRADRPYDEDPAVNLKRQELMREKRAIQIRLQPLQDKVEFASTPEIVALNDRIQDAGLQIVHIGEPKTPAEAAEKAELEARRVTGRKRRQELVDQLVGAETYAAIERIKGELQSVDQKLAALPAPRLVYSAASYFARAGAFRPSLEPRPVSLLVRGSVSTPGALASPGALRCVTGLTASFGVPPGSDEGARRAALAQWIAHRDNVLTWRSIVNRVWHYHFGAGIVDTPSDFGRMGSQPSHPELLDWLSIWFRDDAQGSLKKLHHLIVTSAAYRQSSANRADGEKLDSENRLLWRMNRGKLEAEAVHDSVLAFAGRLDLTMGGPGARLFAFKDDHSPVYDYTKFDPDDSGSYRRSIYRFIVRSVPDPFLERLDCPDPSGLAPKRSTTLTAIQALTLLNNPFMVRMAQHFAERLQKENSGLPAQITAASQLMFGRAPAAAELKDYETYAERYGLANLCRLLFNTNEFLFVD